MPIPRRITILSSKGRRTSRLLTALRIRTNREGREQYYSIKEIYKYLTLPLLFVTQTHNFSPSKMCRYFDVPVKYSGCKVDVKHIIIERRYNLCDNPQNKVGTARYCDTEHVQPLDNAPLFGSTLITGDCVTCNDPNVTMIHVDKSQFFLKTHAYS